MTIASCKHGVGAFQPCRECDDETDKAAILAERDRLRAELAEVKRDADRYRWWRRFFVPDAPLLPDAVAEAYTGEELDAAIDAAMAGGK